MTTVPKICAIVLLLQLAQGANASNLRVSSVNLEEAPETDGFVISFDIGWDRSWRNDVNWDAAWVFVKYKTASSAAPDTLDDLETFELRPDWPPLLDRGLLPPELKRSLKYKGYNLQQVTLETLEKGSMWEMRVQQQGVWRQETFERTYLLEADDSTLDFSSLTWQHVDVIGGAAQPEGTVVEDVEDKKGVFIYRSEDGEGRFEAKRIQLLWDLDPTTMPSSPDTIDVWVFGIEMVFVPSGPFWIGDPDCSIDSGPTACFYDFAEGSGAYYVEAEGATIPVCEKGDGDVTPVCYGTSSTGASGDRMGPIPSTFPKGVDAFYAMKYEMTQQQYSNFLNTLPSVFALQNRYPYVGEGQQGSRLTVYFTPSGASTLALQSDRADNWVAWIDNAAFIDWAALRPMTELEFEKACRGPGEPVASEYAWGNSSYVSSAGRIVGPELPYSVPSVNGNVNINDNSFIGGDGGQGPLPGDGFVLPRGKYQDALLPPGEATFVYQPNDEPVLKRKPLPYGLGFRELEGRSYYGLMQMSGNLWEMTVTVGTEEGRKFQAVNGDGQVTYAGNSNVPEWPKRGAFGMGFRGGSWLAGTDSGQVASRYQAANAYPVRSPDFGLRAVRSVSRTKESE